MITLSSPSLYSQLSLIYVLSVDKLLSDWLYNEYIDLLNFRYYQNRQLNNYKKNYPGVSLKWCSPRGGDLHSRWCPLSLGDAPPPSRMPPPQAMPAPGSSYSVPMPLRSNSSPGVLPSATRGPAAPGGACDDGVGHRGATHPEPYHTFGFLWRVALLSNGGPARSCPPASAISSQATCSPTLSLSLSIFTIITTNRIGR